MSLNIGKRDVAKLAALLDPDYKTLEPEQAEALEAMARSAIEYAFDLYESKFKWTVVGQMRYNPHLRGRAAYLDADDALASKIALGAYGTETQAKNAALSLTFSQDGMEFATWYLPVFHGTPAAYFKTLNEKRKSEEASARSPFLAEMERRVKWFNDHPGAVWNAKAKRWEIDGEPIPDDMQGSPMERVGWGGVTPNVTPGAAA